MELRIRIGCLCGNHMNRTRLDLYQWVSNFVLATLVFAHFAFATLNFHILLLPCQFLVMHHFRPLWGKCKMKMVKFCFAFASTVVVLL